MFEHATPESVGISSESILKFLKMIDKRGAIMHSLLIFRNEKLVSENYWKPFDENFCHRMYSQTKSYTAIAIGLLEEEGKLSLDDKIIDYFPEKLGDDVCEYLKVQTIRQMLTMTTAGHPKNWFSAKAYDRVEHYFNNRSSNHPAGTIWQYDSAGSQVLCALAEKLSGMPLLEYLRKKLFDKMGTFKTAEILKTPNGVSWGDSALLCTPRDMASFGQLLMNGGKWNGEQLIDEKFVLDATSRLVDNSSSWFDTCFYHGYGYQIWKCQYGGFAFVGMGDQLTICLPDKNFMFVCTADHQGANPVMRNILVNGLFDIIVDEMKDEALPENPEAQKALKDATSDLSLRAVKSRCKTDFYREISGKKYVCSENKMGITEFKFVFDGADSGKFIYTNAQGEKEIPFGVDRNAFGKFPELGYSNEMGGVVTTDGFMYNDAVSLAWLDEKKLILLVQIIDRYFGVMSATFAFIGNEASAEFVKCAEDFFDTYEGELSAKLAD